jgi:hypothetical protein
MSGSADNESSSAAAAAPSSSGSANLTELNETVSRLMAHAGVESVQILNQRGDIVTGNASARHAVAAQKLLHAAREYLELDDTSNNSDATAAAATPGTESEVSFLQLRSASGRELLVAPHEGYTLAVLKRE